MQFQYQDLDMDESHKKKFDKIDIFFFAYCSDWLLSFFFFFFNAPEESFFHLPN